MKVKLLPSINRGEPVSVSEETVALSVDFCKLYPDIIVGIDFSGNPNKGNFEEFMPALTLARKHGLMLAIHCAEIPNRSEIKQMLMFGMSRCGHGTYLTSADYAYMKQHNIAVECCLTSNIKSGTVESLQYHHIKRLIEAEVPRVLCTDDSGVFDTTLSNEFYLATEAFGLTQTQCIDLTMEAIDHAFASCEEKQNLKIQLDAFISQMTVKDNRVHKTKRYIEKKTCE
ncbi:Ada [Drosophila busckii]|uniref:Ada n=2 Tax=Drosophila busckii TaxID=30019 RepID=A0A0M4ECD4_DROBS|nr:Ada [Drosophila busckii]